MRVTLTIVDMTSMAPARPQPPGAADRITNLDTIRGVAVLGKKYSDLPSDRLATRRRLLTAEHPEDAVQRLLREASLERG